MIVAKLLARLQKYNHTHCEGHRCQPDNGAVPHSNVKVRDLLKVPYYAMCVRSLSRSLLFILNLEPWKGTPTATDIPAHSQIWLPWRGSNVSALCDTNRR